jgi:hypothetical protein
MPKTEDYFDMLRQQAAELQDKDAQNGHDHSKNHSNKKEFENDPSAPSDFPDNPS